MERGIVRSAALALVATFITPTLAKAQQIATPLYEQRVNAGEYARQAKYFRGRELLFRAKAQNLIKSVELRSGPYPMATKTVTRAEVSAREYIEYLSKAEQNARAAATYNEALTDLGFKPIKIPSSVVSVKDLQRANEEQ